MVHLFCKLTPKQFDEEMKTADVKTAKLEMLRSKWGPGIFTITRKVFSDHTRYTYEILPNNLTGRTKGSGGYFTEKDECLKHARTEHEILLKIDTVNKGQAQ